MDRKPRGLNFRQSKTGIIDMGIHIDQFSRYCTEVKANANEQGWINFTIYPNENPAEKKGYSHQATLKTESKTCKPISIDEAFKRLKD
jgi:hypothetical protein